MSALALAHLASLSGCAVKPDTTKSFLKGCSYGADQANTFLGDWRNRPVPISFGAGNFSPAEKAAMLAAIDSWNAFYNQVSGYPVFDGGGGQEAAISSPPMNICGNTIVKNGAFTDRVIVYKRLTGWSYGTGAIGVTTTCPDTHGIFYSAQMEINYTNFFGSQSMKPDLQSILLHELGHLGGLDHSCTTGGRNARGLAVPDCGSPSLAADYYAAVMYPVMHFAGGIEVPHTSLENNDQGRANCLHWAP